MFSRISPASRLQEVFVTTFFSEEDVSRVLTMEVAIEAVEEGFRLLGNGGAVNRPRQRIKLPQLMLHVMPAGSAALGYAGLKAYTAGPGGARFVFLLFEAESGKLEAVMDADALGQIRTGAASGVATRHLALPDASTVGIFGTGWQARSQLEAVLEVRRVESALACGRDPAKCKTFCREMAERLAIPVRPSVPEEVAAADIVITATSSRKPVLLGEWLRPGQHINAIGANFLHRRELDESAVERAACIVVDSREQAELECGDLVPLVEAGTRKWGDLVELGDIVAGKAPFEREEEAITLFESQGIALEDVAVARRVLERGRAQRLGTDLPF